MRGAHQLALRRERNLADAREAVLERLGRRAPPCSAATFSAPSVGIAEHAPPAVVARRSSALFASDAGGQRPLAPRVRVRCRRPAATSAASELALAARSPLPVTSVRAPTPSPPRARSSRCASACRSCRVADHRRRAQRLDGREPADDRVALRHALHAEREHHRRHRGQALGHRRRPRATPCRAARRRAPPAERSRVHERGSSRRRRRRSRSPRCRGPCRVRSSWRCSGVGSASVGVQHAGDASRSRRCIPVAVTTARPWP